MAEILLFPSDYFDGRKIDPELENEYNAAKETGLFEIVLFKYTAWAENKKIVLNRQIEKSTKAVYRGWMMKPEEYRMFYKALLEENLELVTVPLAYEYLHVFPNVYIWLKDDTPLIEVFPLHERIDLKELHSKMKNFMVKDYVKSAKGTDFPRYFEANMPQSEFDQKMELFYKYRGSMLTGGICIKEYVDLKKYGDKVNEYRVFYINHRITTISRNSGQHLYTPEPPAELLKKYDNLPSPFYTIDYAEREDGSWIIIETGDGSVSGLSDNQNAVEFYRALYYSLFVYQAEELPEIWKCIGTCSGSHMLSMFGLDDIGDYENLWKNTRYKVFSTFRYDVIHWLYVYEIVVNGQKHRFACTEFCGNGGWAFALPDDELEEYYYSKSIGDVVVEDRFNTDERVIFCIKDDMLIKNGNIIRVEGAYYMVLSGAPPTRPYTDKLTLQVTKLWGD